MADSDMIWLDAEFEREHYPKDEIARMLKASAAYKKRFGTSVDLPLGMSFNDFADALDEAVRSGVEFNADRSEGK